jgi:hypothetical protein
MSKRAYSLASGHFGADGFRGSLCIADRAYISAKIRDLASAFGGASSAPPKAGMQAGPSILRRTAAGILSGASSAGLRNLEYLP